MTNSNPIVDRLTPSRIDDFQIVRQTNGTIFADDFEEYSSGTVPSNFVLAGNTDQGVVSGSSSSESQAYRMNGSHGGCWRAIARTPIETADTMTIRGAFKRGDGSVGCHEDQSGGIRLRTVASSSWSEGSAAGLLRFKPDGSVVSNGEVVGEYIAGEWTDFEITYNRANGTITHECVINGNSTVSVERDVVNHEDELSALELKSDDFTVYWDNLSVTTGSSEDTTQIHDWNDLHTIRNNLDGDYTLATDLDRDTAGYDTHVEEPENGWEPIGSEASPFTGTFDGNAHSIKGLNFEAPPFNESTYEANEEYLSAGLFATVSDCIIRNLSLEDITISGWGFVGGLVGLVNDVDGSSFSNLSVQGSIQSSNNQSYCGGVLGNVSVREGPIELRQIESNVNVEGAVAGGICGGFFPEGRVADADHIIENTHATGTITGEATSGGIAGSLFNGTLRRVSASAAIQSKENQTEGGYSSFKPLGGLVGNCESAVIDRSFAMGSVLVSDLREEVQAFAGGIAGILAVSSETKRSYSIASVGSNSSGYIGGLVGLADGATISTCYAAGEVSGGSEAGGLVPQPIEDDGNPEVQITDTFWDVDATGQSSSFGIGDANGLSTEEMTGEDARENFQGFDFGEIWEVTDEYPILSWEEERTRADPPDSTDGGLGTSPPSTDSDLRDRLREATVEERVTIGDEEYLVLREIPDEPENRLAFSDTEYQLLEPNAAVNVAVSYRFCDSYVIDNKQRLEYTNYQYEAYDYLESVATVANLLSELSGVVALSKVSPASAASNAVDLLQVAVDWSTREMNDPYHEQFARMAAASDVVNWSDEHTPDPGASLLGATDEALDVTETMIGAYEAVDGISELATSASTVRDVFSAANGIRDNVSPSSVSGIEDLKHAGYTALASMATDAVVDAVSGIAEGQTRVAAMGRGQAAARRPIVSELIELEERANNFDLGPAGILRMHTLHQADYQIESAALHGQAALIEEYQSSGLGAVITQINGTEDTYQQARELGETYRNLSHFRGAVTGEVFSMGVIDHRESLNEEVYGEQTLLEAV